MLAVNEVIFDVGVVAVVSSLADELVLAVDVESVVEEYELKA